MERFWATRTHNSMCSFKRQRSRHKDFSAERFNGDDLLAHQKHHNHHHQLSILPLATCPLHLLLVVHLRVPIPGRFNLHPIHHPPHSTVPFNLFNNRIILLSQKGTTRRVFVFGNAPPHRAPSMSDNQCGMFNFLINLMVTE